MRHQQKGFKLGRTHSHRKATLSALSNALIRHKRITTTLAKARALRMYVEPILNRAKNDTMQNRRQTFRSLQDKESVKELFGDIAEHIGDRLGGYTRLVKLGQRSGDAAEMAVIELVDYNDVKPDGSGKAKRRQTRRSRRKSTSSAESPATKSVAEVTEAPVDDSAKPATEVSAEPASEPAASPEAEAPAKSEAEDASASEGKAKN